MTEPARLSSMARAAAEPTPSEETATIISCPTWSRRLSELARSAQRTGCGLGVGVDVGLGVADGADRRVDGAELGVLTADGETGATLALTAGDEGSGLGDATGGTAPQAAATTRQPARTTGSASPHPVDAPHLVERGSSGRASSAFSTTSAMAGWIQYWPRATSSAR